MKLYYFPLPGRAECSRIMLKLSGIEFEDVRFTRDAWMGEYKALSPTGQAPFLELDDGKRIAQSSAIDRYIGKITGFYPEDALEAAKVDMLNACLEDVTTSMTPTWALPEDERAAARAALFAEGGASAQKMQVIENLIADRTTEFFASDKLTLGDLVIFNQMSMMLSGFFDGLNKDTVAQFPATMALRDKVASHPDIVPIYAECGEDPIRRAFV